jgi:predicted DNA-binding protein
MITESMGLGVSAAQHGAQIVSLSANSTYRGATKAYSLRLPRHVAVKIDAMATKSGRNTNATVLMLVEIGIEELSRHLSEEVQKELFELVSAGLSEGNLSNFESSEV